MKPQPRLGTGGFVGLLVVSNTLIPFSSDIYTPSLPELPHYFNTSEALVNLTILGFFLFLTLGMLFFGPISDKIGRKPVLLAGFIVYVGSSALCAVAENIYFFIAMRILQALGAGAVMAITTALIKDCLIPKRRPSVLAIIQVLSVLGPVAAPLLGGIIISFAPWHVIFWALTGLGAVCLIGAFLYTESLPVEERSSGSVLGSLVGLARVAKHRKFMLVLLASCGFNAAFLAYIAVGSYIYVDFFGETQQVYTYFFAASSGIAALGPMMHLRLGKNLSPWHFTYVLLTIGLLVGVGLLTIGSSSVWIFAILLTLLTMLQTTMRPYTTNLMLTMAKGDTGSASSMINFLFNGFGVAGMALIMLPFPSYIIGIGVLLVVCMVIAFPLWMAACNTQERRFTPPDTPEQ